MQQDVYQQTQDRLTQWQIAITNNIYDEHDDLGHTMQYYLAKEYKNLAPELAEFGEIVASQLECLVNDNHEAENLPKLDAFNKIGQAIDLIVHHPSYIKAGDLIYGSKLMHYFVKPGNMLPGLCLFLLSSHAGEAGHNCPIACSAGILRVFSQVPEFKHKQHYIEKLIAPSFTDNFTGAQFVTEIQGGSDVGQNVTQAYQDQAGHWRLKGEKWFCSNANAELMLVTARYKNDMANSTGTKGLALFLVPAKLTNGERNQYHIKRLKQKLGTRSMATAEINFNDAVAIPMGELGQGFKLLMENVLHISRIFNCFTVLGMARRAYQIAKSYAQHRPAFKHDIINYPLVQEKLALIKAENSAMLAGSFAMVQLQDAIDTNSAKTKEAKLLLRLLANLCKSFTAMHSVKHIHHAIDILAGNGTIETFSNLPRLLKDAIVCENWEGTHYTLWMQILRDIHKNNLDQLFVDFVSKQIEALEPSEYKTKLKAALALLLKDLAALKASDSQLQTLLIKDIVNTMAIIWCSLALLNEAIDQTQNHNQKTKLDCLVLFNQHYLTVTKTVEKQQLDQDYLDLLQRILA